jgi:hypothetical protein
LWLAPLNATDPAGERQAGLEETLEAILEAHSAGSPTDEAVRWTDLKPLQLAQQLLVRGFEIGRNTTAKLLQGAGYRRRSLRKELITGQVDPEERDQQFRYIDTLRRQARARGVPVLCVDTKKKKPLGYLHRRGRCYSNAAQTAYDHDYRHLATGLLVPHGVYDYHDHAGFITLGSPLEIIYQRRHPGLDAGIQCPRWWVAVGINFDRYFIFGELPWASHARPAPSSAMPLRW